MTMDSNEAVYTDWNSRTDIWADRNNNESMFWACSSDMMLFQTDRAETRTRSKECLFAFLNRNRNLYI